MNIDQAKKQSKALASALKTMGIAEISPTLALDVLARMHGKRNWQTAKAAGSVGKWSAVQALVYQAYPNADLLPLAPGDDVTECGDGLFISLMGVAGPQPLSRVIVTLTHWLDGVNLIQASVVKAIEQAKPFNHDAVAVPVSLPTRFRQFLQVELAEDTSSWLDVCQRLESTRRDLYAVLSELICEQRDSRDNVMVLQSTDGGAYGVAVRVPSSWSMDTARQVADKVIEELHTLQDCGECGAFDYSVCELKVRLAQEGLVPVSDTYAGPFWD